MLTLVSLFLSIPGFPSALAAPADLPDALASWAPGSLRLLQQYVLDFLNPFHTPSATQAIISCSLLIFLSAITAGPRTLTYRQSNTRVLAFRLRLGYFIYGLVAPDLYAIAAWYDRINEACAALIYDKLFNKDAPKKYRWTSIHGAFILKGGFILWENNKPAKVLQLVDLVRMTKSGEIEFPTLSKEDILSRSTRPRPIAARLLIIPLYWFIPKFIFVLPALTALAVIHGTLSWCAYFWRSTTIATVVEPVVIIRRPQELKEKQMPQDMIFDLEKAHSFNDDVVDKLGTTTGEDQGSTRASEKLVETSDETLTTPEDTSKKSTLDFLYVRRLLVEVSAIIFSVFLAITSPMRAQWRTISSPRNITTLSRYLAGTIITLLGWGVYFHAANKIPLPSELERNIWRVASLFILAQPVTLLLAPRWIRTRIWGCIKTATWIVYNLAYAASRVSIFVIAFRTIKLAK